MKLQMKLTDEQQNTQVIDITDDVINGESIQKYFVPCHECGEIILYTNVEATKDTLVCGRCYDKGENS